jgi:hypothetical protein
MKTLLQVCLVAVLIGLPLWLVFWGIVRPVVLVRLKYRVFAARDQLRLLAIDQVSEAHTRAFRIIDRMCNSVLHKIEWLNFAEIMMTRPSRQAMLEVENDLQIVNDAGPQMRAVYEQIQRVMIGGVILNSPGMLILVSPFAFAVVTAYWFARVQHRLDGWRRLAWRAVYAEPCPA